MDNRQFPMAPGIVTFVVSVLLMAVGILFAMPSNVFVTRNPTGTLDSFIHTLDPQDWAFFTKNPQDKELLAFDSATGESLMVTPQNRWHNGMGLSRTQRAQGPELANIANQIPAIAWTHCDEEEILRAFDPPYPEKNSRAVIPTELVNPGCLTQDSAARQAKNTSRVPTICGDVTLAFAIPVPFEYQDFTDRNPQLTDVVRATVNCEANQ